MRILNFGSQTILRSRHRILCAATHRPTRPRYLIPSPAAQQVAFTTSKMSTVNINDEEDEFGLSSGDEADFVALTSSIEAGASQKRKASFDDVQEVPPAKKTASMDLSLTYLATKTLTKNFGMSAFRPMQEKAITRLLGGESAAVIFPTGGGKSLCFQIPALVFPEVDKRANIRGDGESGISICVSPLIALMKDQVDALVRRGIKGVAVMDSTKTKEEYMKTIDQIRNGDLRLIYCAPERLNNEGFVEMMKHVRGGVRLVAVDEAHCISEWGHAFRPDYLKVARFAKEIKAERVVCLTATATPRVARDICQAFNIDEKEGLFQTSTYRTNLELLAESGMTKKELSPRLVKFLRENPGPSIVYVTIRKQAEDFALYLAQQGFNVKAFHAGMQTAEKTQIQEAFMKSEDMIIVATIAFGMGIDKANIRNVVHYNIPSSIESYSQEIGRAGRDGKPSKCMFYVCGEDLHLREMFARGDLPSRESIRDCLEDIFDSDTRKLPIGGEIKRVLTTQGKQFDIRATSLQNIYVQLELTHGYIRATTPQYSKYSYKPNFNYESKIRLDYSLAAIAIKTSARKASKLYHLDVNAAADAQGIPRKDVIQKLQNLEVNGALELNASGVINVFKLTKAPPKTAEEISKITDSIYEFMVQREQDQLARTDQILSLITGTSCFSRALAQHFGDDLPDGKTECGHCTWCLTHKPVVQQIPPPVPFNTTAFQAILEMVPVRDDPRFLAKVAFGIVSPRVTAMKLNDSRPGSLFGTMADHPFMDLLDAFTKECKVGK